MADNVPITAGSGTNIATDDIGGTHFQRVKVAHGADGTATDTSESAPLPVVAYGELVEALEALRFIGSGLLGSVGRAFVDSGNRLIINVNGNNTLGTVTNVTTVATVTTVSTVSNQTQIGGVSASPQIPALLQVAADSLRRNITTS
jgi:hypothetical protein